MRLDKFLVECGIGSRKEVKELIQNREVFVNGVPSKDPTLNIKIENDKIEYKSKVLVYKEFRYYILNKLSGYVTALVDSKSPTVMELLPEWVNKKDLFPVGRLDKDTVGLLLFTNNGKLAHELISPKKHVDKVYYVEVENSISKEDITRLEEGIDIGGYITKPSKAEKISDKKLYLNIQEGKFHQVKKMMHGISNEVTYLKRVTFGKLELGNLEAGSVIEIELKDII
jgi:16S rRNA pseudouridine516 synthase